MLDPPQPLAGASFSFNICNDTSVDPKQPVYFEIKKPPWVSVVWVVIACCICSKHDPCIYAARNAQPQRGKIFATQKSFDGASEASGVFYQQRNKFRRSERSERSLISNKKPVATERAKRAEFFLFAINIIFLS